MSGRSIFCDRRRQRVDNGCSPKVDRAVGVASYADPVQNGADTAALRRDGCGYWDGLRDHVTEKQNAPVAHRVWSILEGRRDERTMYLTRDCFVDCVMKFCPMTGGRRQLTFQAGRLAKARPFPTLSSLHLWTARRNEVQSVLRCHGHTSAYSRPAT